MTERLEQALQRVESLSAEQQDAIAALILANLDDEEGWARLREQPNVLRAMMREHGEEH
jgi:hypothetical protein